MLAATLLLLLGISPAQAETAPRILPDRDVSVTYQLSVPGRPEQSYQLQYDAAGQRARISDPDLPTYFLLDLPSGAAELVVPQLHSVVATPDLSGLSQQITQARHSASFTLLGDGEYAGLSCRNWRITSRQGTAIACLTRDGVPLHFDGKDEQGSATLTATAVSFAPQPAEAFTPPAGYSAVNLPPDMVRQLISGG